MTLGGRWNHVGMTLVLLFVVFEETLPGSAGWTRRKTHVTIIYCNTRATFELGIYLLYSSAPINPVDSTR